MPSAPARNQMLRQRGISSAMAFFYFFARLTLFCAAWIATAEYKDDPRMPGKTQP
ncbi:hypothetical protein ACUOFC_37525, partial [Escherichia sp. TWPC-MK]